MQSIGLLSTNFAQIQHCYWQCFRPYNIKDSIVAHSCSEIFLRLAKKSDEINTKIPKIFASSYYKTFFRLNIVLDNVLGLLLQNLIRFNIFVPKFLSFLLQNGIVSTFLFQNFHASCSKIQSDSTVFSTKFKVSY